MFNKPLTIALTAVGLLGLAACERDQVDEGVDKEVKVKVGEEVKVEEGAKTEPGARMEPGAKVGERPEPQKADEGQLSADMQRRMDTAQERLDKLEKQAKEAKEAITARGAEVRTELDQDLERARMEAQTKLEEARKASAQTVSQAIDDLEKALDDLDAKLKNYSQT